MVHHPLFGIALKERMDELGVECVVQYRDSASKKKIRHSGAEQLFTQVQFIEKQFAKARLANQR